MKGSGIIYLDHAATTYTDPEVLEAMLPYFTDKFYNPSSFYSPARECSAAIDEAREKMAKILGADDPDEIIFTGGGSESDNLAIYGICMANADRGKHIISIPIEHHAVLHPLEEMKRLGFEYTLVPVDEYGMVRVEDVERAIRDDTVLITIMYANNEVGTIQPIEEIGRLAKERGIFFHTDAVQACGALPIDVKKLNVDALSISAHKFYGPKGVGALYLRKGVKIRAHISGGGQEKGRRAGTHNTPGIVGLAKALEIAYKNLEENNERISHLRNKLVKRITEEIPDVLFNGHPTHRLPNNASFCFKYIDSEAILLHLNLEGICVSSGSACSTGSDAPSHVLSAMGIPPEVARGSIRMTLGKGTTEEEIDRTIEVTKNVVEKLRAMSPIA